MPDDLTTDATLTPLSLPLSPPGDAARAMLPPGIDAAQIETEVERIAVSPAFRTSRRSCGLLRHIVEYALSGNIEDLKERRIGADVFGRPADYDTNSDHIVRSVAGDVRRRLAQYYTQSGADSEIRIELLAGSYVPQFHRARSQHQPAIAVVPAPQPAVAGPRPRIWNRRTIAAGAALCCVVGAAIVIAGRTGHRLTPLERFWQPVYSSSSPVLLCVGGGGSGPNASEPEQPKTVIEFALAPSRRIHTYDAMVLASVTGLLQANRKAYKLLNRAGTTSFRELQSGPFVLIGSMNNEWSLRLIKDFRFSFARSAAGALVVDKQNPSNQNWRVDPATPIEQLNRDYAIVSRFRDPETEQTAVILAGIGPWGSLASGEFVTNPEYLKKLADIAPAAWQDKNLQVVISTDVIHGSSGPPIVIAAHFW
jgi:hypothetical protein